MQLDGIRALAVAAVLVNHFTGRFFDHVKLGGIAVRLFFVLSGFLITGILLRERDRAAVMGTSRLFTLRQFYARRFLRIFPVFYLCLALVLLANVENIRDRWLWHASYLTNFMYSRDGRFYGKEGHWWSLAVEEQFYLIWPWLVLFVPRRWMFRLIVGTVLAGVASRFISLAMHLNPLAVELMTPACLDALALGGLLALLSEPGYELTHRRSAFFKVCVFIGLPFFLVGMAAHFLNRMLVLDLLTADLGISLLSVVLIAGAVDGYAGRLGKFLTNRQLVFVGAISYGVYVYHNFMPNVANSLFSAGGYHTSSPWPRTLVAFPLTIAVAAVSWFLYEKPLNDLKRFFPYQRRTGSGLARPSKMA